MERAADVAAAAVVVALPSAHRHAGRVDDARPPARPAPIPHDLGGVDETSATGRRQCRSVKRQRSIWMRFL
jgi:hypothetical protein